MTKRRKWNFKKAEDSATPDVTYVEDGDHAIPVPQPSNAEPVGQHGILTVGRMGPNVRISLGVQGYGQLYTHFNVEEAVHIAQMILQQTSEVFTELKQQANATAPVPPEPARPTIPVG